MARTLGLLNVAVLGLAGVLWVSGCQSTGSGREGDGAAARDDVIQHYMERRSELLGQRRRLAAVHGERSEIVADVDRQIAVVDRALQQRQETLVREQQAREELQRQKAGIVEPQTGPDETQPAAQEAQ